MEKTNNLQAIETVPVPKGTHPLLTVLVYSMVIGGLVTSGSYFSKQRMAAKEMEEGLRIPLNAFATLGH
jgi:hypothetical protein